MLQCFGIALQSLKFFWRSVRSAPSAFTITQAYLFSLSPFDASHHFFSLITLYVSHIYIFFPDFLFLFHTYILYIYIQFFIYIFFYIYSFIYFYFYNHIFIESTYCYFLACISLYYIYIFIYFIYILFIYIFLNLVIIVDLIVLCHHYNIIYFLNMSYHRIILLSLHRYAYLYCVCKSFRLVWERAVDIGLFNSSIIRSGAYSFFHIPHITSPITFPFLPSSF